MDKLEQHIVKMQGIFDCLLMQKKINRDLSRLLSTGLELIYQASQVYSKQNQRQHSARLRNT